MRMHKVIAFAWRKVREILRDALSYIFCVGFPLVMRNRGGASGTGTVLTVKGKHLMDAYDQFAARMKKEADLLYNDFFHDSMNLP